MFGGCLKNIEEYPPDAPDEIIVSVLFWVSPHCLRCTVTGVNLAGVNPSAGYTSFI